MRSRLFQRDDFETTLCEIEAVLNKRPLTYASASSEDERDFLPIRPIDFIASQVEVELPRPQNEGDDPNFLLPHESTSTRKSVLKHLEVANKTVDAFWKTWNRAYLTQLRDIATKKIKGGTSSPHIDDFVLVKDNFASRSDWMMGRIISLRERSAILLTGNGRTTERPLCDLIPLECPSEESSSLNGTPATPSNTPDTPSVTKVISQAFSPATDNPDILADSSPETSSHAQGQFQETTTTEEESVEEENEQESPEKRPKRIRKAKRDQDFVYFH